MATITVSLNPVPTAPIDISFTIGGGTKQTKTIPANMSRYTIPGVMITPQSVGATPVIVFDDTADYDLGTGGTMHTLLPLGTRPAGTPVATFSMAGNSVGEGDGTATITVNLSPAPTSQITLSYSVGGTVQTGDYMITDSGTVTVPANAASVDITVTINDDNTDEMPETLILTITGGGSQYTVGSTAMHTLTITDDDGTSVTRTRVSDAGPTLDDGTYLYRGEYADLGASDRAELARWIDIEIAAIETDLTSAGVDCGSGTDCERIKGMLADMAKAYTPLTETQFDTEIGKISDVDANTAWVIQLDNWRPNLVTAAYGTAEGSYAPYLKNNNGTLTDDGKAAIRGAVGAVVRDRNSNFDWGVNRIASDLDPEDNWGLWIKQDDAGKLYYWHTPEDGRKRLGGPDSTLASDFAGYAGSATYRGSVDGYGYYGTANDGGAGEFAARIMLDAQFGADGDAAASITGEISNFRGEGIDPASPDDLTVSLDSNNGASGPGVTGFWRSDYVYRETGSTATNDLQPGGIRGRVVLESTDANAPAGAAGVFNAVK